MALMNWENADSELVKSIAAEANKYLEGQLTVASSADQRASVMAGVFTGAATAILAGLAALAAGEAKVANPYAIYGGGGATCLFFFIGAFLCIFAVMPSSFYIPGKKPLSWRDVVAERKNLDTALPQLIEFMQHHIDKNNKSISRNASFFRWGTLSGIAAPIIGAAIFLIFIRHVF